MTDYLNFLDLEALDCADAAFARKHRKLMHYPGDRMLPIQMAVEGKEKARDFKF